MKKYLLTVLSAFALVTMASAQVMKVYQNGELSSVYYLEEGDNVEFSDDFPFPDEPGIHAGHAYVDLGLSVKWATTNVGAENPEDCGHYFAWGEIEREVLSDSPVAVTTPWYFYKWCERSENTLTKYCTDEEYGRVDNKTELTPNDDAACAWWKGNWRMPTAEEQLELRDNCTWTWTSKTLPTGAKRKGYLVTSNINGNSIFLPAAGVGLQGPIVVGQYGTYINMMGNYWSKTLHDSEPLYGANILFTEEGTLFFRYMRCSYGSIRPVCE